MGDKQFHAAASLVAADRVGVRRVREWERSLGGEAAAVRFSAFERKYRADPDDVRPVACLIVEGAMVANGE
jgi:hypothetical protein